MIDYTSLNGATVCLCAPDRTLPQVVDLEVRLGHAGALVVAPTPGLGGGEPSPAEDAVLADLHRRRIEAADAVIVANPGGYIGAGVATQIAHALRLGAFVHCLENPAVLTVDADPYVQLLSRTSTRQIRPLDPATPVTVDGSLLEIACGSGAGRRRAWVRAVQAHRFADRDELAHHADTSRLAAASPRPRLPGLVDEHGPGPGGGGGFEAIEVEFLGEIDPRRVRFRSAHAKRFRAAAGASLLVRDGAGRVLLVPAQGPVGGWRLPGAVIDGGEFPWHAARRGAAALLDAPVLQAEMLGAPVIRAPKLLVIDHLIEETDNETVAEYVFDAGTVTAEHAHHLQAVAGPTAGARFATATELPDLVTARLARRIGAALARLDDPSAPTALEHGFVPGSGPDWAWSDGDHVPEGIPVGQVSVWAFDADGRVLLQHRVAQRRFQIPGGGPEPQDQDLVGTAEREALEESQVVIDRARAVVIGYQITYQDRGFPNGLVQVRIAAPIARYLPIAPDTDPALAGSRPAYRRYLVDVGRAGELLDFGDSGYLQADAARRAAIDLDLPAGRPPADGYRDHGDGEIAPASTAGTL